MLKGLILTYALAGPGVAIEGKPIAYVEDPLLCGLIASEGEIALNRLTPSVEASYQCLPVETFEQLPPLQRQLDLVFVRRDGIEFARFPGALFFEVVECYWMRYLVMAFVEDLGIRNIGMKLDCEAPELTRIPPELL